MRRPPQQEQGGAAAEWLATYSDLVTLLFTFFVLLFAISQVDVQKYNILAAAFSNKGASAEEILKIAADRDIKSEGEVDLEDPRFPTGDQSASGAGAEGNPLADAHKSIQGHIEQSGMAGKVSAFLGDDYIFIRFVDEVLFEPNRSDVRSQDYALLDFVGKSLKAVQDDVGMIRIDGHTAAVPEQENYHISDRELSSERANAVLEYFENVVGIRGDKLTAFAFGKYRPVAENDTEEGRKQNRRIEILVTKTNNITTQLDNIYEKIFE